MVGVSQFLACNQNAGQTCSLLVRLAVSKSLAKPGEWSADHRFREILQGSSRRHRSDDPRDRPLRARLSRPRLARRLVEGIADHVRFWRYEPGKAGPLNPARAKYDASYRTTAAFLAYVTEKYEPKAVTKLNAILRENKYDAGVWKTLTGKSVEELGKEWKESLGK